MDEKNEQMDEQENKASEQPITQSEDGSDKTANVDTKET